MFQGSSAVRLTNGLYLYLPTALVDHLRTTNLSHVPALRHVKEPGNLCELRIAS